MLLILVKDDKPVLDLIANILKALSGEIKVAKVNPPTTLPHLLNDLNRVALTWNPDQITSIE